jgi:signal transduction histidine kinase
MRFGIEDEVVIGRDESAGIQLDDPNMSRTHARVRRDSSGAFTIEDLGSRDGTFVNGVEVTSARLEFGDRVTVGERTLLFTRVDPTDEHLRQRQRLEALGRMSAGIAHDLNNMLGAIITNVEFIGDDVDIDPRELRDCLRDIGSAARRAAALTPRLLGFARSHAAAFSRVAISDVCHEVTVSERIQSLQPSPST